MTDTPPEFAEDARPCSDWAQLESGTFRFRDPLNKKRCFLPLRLDDDAIGINRTAGLI